MPRYFTDGAGHFARVDTTADFGPVFARAKAHTWNVKRRQWIDAPPGLTSGLRFSGNWDECDAADANKLTAAAAVANAVAVIATQTKMKQGASARAFFGPLFRG